MIEMSTMNIGFQIFNLIFLLGGLFLFGLSIVVLWKANKALTIWIAKNQYSYVDSLGKDSFDRKTNALEKDVEN